MGLPSLEKYKLFFNKTEKNNKFDLCKYPDSERGGVS